MSPSSRQHGFTVSETELVNAHSHCSRNHEEVQKSPECGCFHCLKIFPPSEVTEWLADETVLCPYCGIDSVLGSISGCPLTKEFLDKMNKRWFRVTRIVQRQTNARKAILELVGLTAIVLTLEILFPNDLLILLLAIAGFTTVILRASYEANKTKRNLKPS